MSLGRKIEEFQASLEQLRIDLSLSIGKISALSDQLKDHAETQLRAVALSDKAARLLSKTYTEELYATLSATLKDRVDVILQSIDDQPFANLLQRTIDLTSHLADDEIVSQVAKIDALKKLLIQGIKQSLNDYFRKVKNSCEQDIADIVAESASVRTNGGSIAPGSEAAHNVDALLKKPGKDVMSLVQKNQIPVELLDVVQVNGQSSPRVKYDDKKELSELSFSNVLDKMSLEDLIRCAGAVTQATNNSWVWVDLYKAPVGADATFEKYMVCTKTGKTQCLTVLMNAKSSVESLITREKSFATCATDIDTISSEVTDTTAVVKAAVDVALQNLAQEVEETTTSLLREVGNTVMSNIKILNQIAENLEKSKKCLDKFQEENRKLTQLVAARNDLIKEADKIDITDLESYEENARLIDEKDALVQVQSQKIIAEKEAVRQSLLFATIFNAEEREGETYRGQEYSGLNSKYKALAERYINALDNANATLKLADNKTKLTTFRQKIEEIVKPAVEEKKAATVRAATAQANAELETKKQKIDTDAKQYNSQIQASQQAKCVDQLLQFLDVAFNKNNLRQFWNKEVSWKGKLRAFVCASRVDVGTSFEPFHLPVPRGIYGACTVLNELNDSVGRKLTDLTDANKADILKRACLKMRDRLPEKGEIKDKATEVLYSKITRLLDQTNNLKLDQKEVELFIYNVTKDAKFQSLNLTGSVQYPLSITHQDLSQ